MENHKLNEDDNTPEIVREQMRIAKLEELIRLRLRAGGKKSIYIPYEKQEKNHWCGPASVRMVVRAKGGNTSQKTIAEYMRTDYYGSLDAPLVRNALNRYVANRYQVVSLSTQDILGGTVGSLDLGYPIVANVHGRTLDNRLEEVAGHFVVISGYDWFAYGLEGKSDITYVDPWLGVAKLSTSPITVTSSHMTEAISKNKGVYVRAY